MAISLDLICSKCGADVVTEYVGSQTVEVEPCPCALAAPIPEEPIRLPYMTLARILTKKVVNVTYRKLNGDIRELKGFLGTNDMRHVDSKLHYFHELDENGVESDVSGAICRTNCKCLMVDRMMGVTHYDADSGVETLYEVEEYF